ncbi:ATP12 family chaperone protein [Acuticoccus mangrovi]|uniref:ATPase n=1 Tax=Acuticoccus mangrovi TaxID=2796142 RepID=A0A934MNI3_9HYPH|nr:ATP12 family protein [Acuticoccus mangrovi]MBJ3778214.1 ATPase [Acuticoccus mangrovi]
MAEAPRPPEPAEPIRRFYREASVADHAAGARILLDGRPVRTPAKAHLAAPRPVAERIAAEWNAQGEHILPLTMPMTRLVNTAIDGVGGAVEAVREDIAKMAGSDLVMYRADWPAGLVAAQKQRWDPVVANAEALFGVRIVLVEGVMPVSQDERLTLAVLDALPRDPLPLAALHQLTTLTGSALIALAVARGTLGFDEGWIAAHVDEDWNIAEWGEDAEAARRRAQRRRDAQEAAFVLAPSA